MVTKNIRPAGGDSEHKKLIKGRQEQQNIAQQQMLDNMKNISNAYCDGVDDKICDEYIELISNPCIRRDQG